MFSVPVSSELLLRTMWSLTMWRLFTDRCHDAMLSIPAYPSSSLLSPLSPPTPLTSRSNLNIKIPKIWSSSKNIFCLQFLLYAVDFSKTSHKFSIVELPDYSGMWEFFNPLISSNSGSNLQYILQAFQSTDESWLKRKKNEIGSWGEEFLSENGLANVTCLPDSGYKVGNFPLLLYTSELKIATQAASCFHLPDIVINWVHITVSTYYADGRWNLSFYNLDTLWCGLTRQVLLYQHTMQEKKEKN